MKNNKLNNIESTGFKTPQGYFESLDDKILGKINSENQLNTIKTPGFKVPDDYFKSLNESILDQTTNKKESKIIQLFNKKSLIYISSIAAAILLLFNLSNFSSTPTFDNLDIATVESYFEEEDLSSYEIAALFSDEQIEENIIVEHDFNEDNLEQYLFENADIEALMIE